MLKNRLQNPSKKHLESRLSLEIFLSNKLMYRNLQNNASKHRHNKAYKGFLSFTKNQQEKDIKNECNN